MIQPRNPNEITPSLATAATTGAEAAFASGADAEWPALVAALVPDAEAGNAIAQRLLGKCFEGGCGVPASLALAVQWYGRAATSRDVEASRILGLILAHGRAPIPADGESAVRIMKVAAKGGDLVAQRELGIAMFHGTWATENHQQAAVYLKLAADRGDLDAQWRYGALLMAGRDGIKGDPALGRAYLDAAIARGDHDARLALARFQIKGTGNVELDQPSGIACLEALDAEGMVEATTLLAELYLTEWAVVPDPEKLVGYLRKNAERGDRRAMGALGLVLLKGQQAPRDPASACRWFQQAVEVGADPTAAFLLGLCFWTGDGVTKDGVQALRYLQIAVDTGAADIAGSALHSIGQVYFLGAPGVPRDTTKAGAVLREASAKYGLSPDDFWHRAVRAEVNRDVADLIEIGTAFQDPNDEHADPDAALRFFQLAADAGDANAHFGLGRAHDLGLGVPRDASKAFAHYTIAASAGNADAQYAVGLAYAKGDGVDVDLAAAAAAYLQAAEQGSASAARELGLARWTGAGVDRDEEMAFGLFAMAADKDDPVGITMVATAFLAGRGVERSLKGGMMYYRVGATLGIVDCQLGLGKILARGLDDVPADVVEARVLLGAAAAQGSAEAMAELAALT
jgi:hypothetical protein